MYLDYNKLDAKISSMQQAILDFIPNYPLQYPPTVREIAGGVGLSS
jgi:hypothetical protein